ncbi:MULTISPECIES: dienelactone hydrolase family protein [Pseudomonas aeruginosa group]|uniref:dienelactone hydrolase family protein n=1 Tax=Pseudomonas aeruginosa group TaxID=136841 RepID=UPI00071B8819|nr:MULTISPECIES: dienelactone hydrolase family protein [Pseudomonas aeruginosa group]KSC52939.1 dienelactone hydrolase [Pseudomonas paraeruginosa]KSL20421.1 dienelactone hydrolase [Pseudomonas aeruginosa]MBH8712891.1 dienelactone hydrolase family protein [Pseudomonas aeruginosa]MBI8115867.1 dienelactone hydrolase family protein [Pseudomonas aeruginosa]OKR41560.1 dienelactone hydrolase [Pseudomonas aeruginosa]
MRLLSALLLIACAFGAQAAIQTREMPYQGADGTRMVGYFAYDDSKPGIRPGVIVVHEWWGLNDYAKRRARDLAELGYSALAIDMYGDGKHTVHPQDAMAFMQAATKDADAARTRFLAGLELLKRQPQTDPSQVAAIGYCFGGKIVLDMARQGLPLAGVASFHGALGTTTPASKGSVRAKILVEHGSADSMVPTKDLDALKQELSAAGADYQVVIQDGARHGFTNPDADAHRGHGLDIGYDRQADQRSWADLQAFLEDIFKRG